MISKKDLAVYEWEHIDDYYNYIVESRINGQIPQVRDLIQKLSKKQLKDFLEYVEIDCPNEKSSKYMFYYLGL